MFEYFGKQKKIYPKKVRGKFRTLKWVAMAVTLGIYYLTPFIRWDRGPYAPSQAVLIDLPARKAYWFWIEIWPQEVYILTGILIFAAIMLFFITSLLGRVWCGYFCPQTVWTDLYVWVERLVQGDRFARKKLQEGPWTWEKIYKIAITHTLWIIIAWCTAGSFVLYFNDAPALVRSFFEFNVSPVVLGFIASLTFSTYLMAGFAREQVCIYMCPYARFQSAMFDQDTLIIGYDEKRGEPRGKHKKGTEWLNHGHCIDCTACVQVCPMGIDIRDGLQMECIACGLCVDACDNVMEKIGLPSGLIRYDTTNNMDKAGDRKGFKLFRARTVYYVALLAFIGGIMLYALINRSPLELHVLHDRNPLFVQLSTGQIRNTYTLKILNKTHMPRTYTLSVEGLENPALTINGTLDAAAVSISAMPDGVGTYRVFVKSDMKPAEKKDITFILQDNTDPEIRDEYGSIFITRNDL